MRQPLGHADLSTNKKQASEYQFLNEQVSDIDRVPNYHTHPFILLTASYRILQILSYLLPVSRLHSEVALITFQIFWHIKTLKRYAEARSEISKSLFNPPHTHKNRTLLAFHSQNTLISEN